MYTWLSKCAVLHNITFNVVKNKLKLKLNKKPGKLMYDWVGVKAYGPMFWLDYELFFVRVGLYNIRPLICNKIAYFIVTIVLTLSFF